MNKEQDIIQRLEELRVEQLKALKELKKVEKAKRKQRRRTAHGCPVLSKSGNNENNTSDGIITTPGQDEGNARATASKSCVRFDRRRIKAKHIPKEQDVVSVSNANKDSSSSANTAPVKKRKKECSNPHEPEIAVDKEVLTARSGIAFKSNGTIINEKVFNPVESLDKTQKTCSFAEKKAENTPKHVPEQKNKRALPRPLRFSPETHVSNFATCSSGWRTSKIPKKDCVSEEKTSSRKIKEVDDTATTLGKISSPCGASGKAKDRKNSTDTKQTKCDRPDLVHKRIETSKSPSQTNHNNGESREQKPSKTNSNLLEYRKEKVLSSQSIVSTRDQTCIYNFSQNIFSQNLFDDFVENRTTNEDLSDTCEPLTPKRDILASFPEHDKTTMNELPCSGPATNRKENHGADSYVDKVDVTNKDSQKGLVCKMDVVNSNENVPCNEANLRSTTSGENAARHMAPESRTLSDMSLSNPFPLQEKPEKRTANSSILTEGIDTRMLSSKLPCNNSLPQRREMGETVQDEKSSTVVTEDVLTQQAKTDMLLTSSTSSLAKVLQAEVGNNQPSQFDEFKSHFVIEDTDKKLTEQENVSFQSNADNVVTDYNVVSKREGVLFNRESERLQPERIEDLLIDFPEIVDIFTNELRLFDLGLALETKPTKGDESMQMNTVSQEMKKNQFTTNRYSPDFDKLLLSQPSSPQLQSITCEGRSSHGDNPIVREICLQHALNVPGSCNEVREMKFLTHLVGATRFDLIAVCLPRLLVLWKAIKNYTSWVVMNKWLIEKNDEIIDIAVASVGSCVVLITGGNFHKALGRVYCLQDNACEEVSFADLGETTCAYKKMCLLPNEDSVESVSIVLASGFEERIVLTKWTMDLVCFCLEDYKDFPEIAGSEVSSLCLVEGSSCLLLGCVDSVMYLWNFNSCELLYKMSLVAKPVCLSAETNSGMIFVSLLYKEENKVDLVAVNPEACRMACLKTLGLLHAIDEQRNKLLHCSKTGAYVVCSYQHGSILMWNIATDSKTVLEPKFGDVCCISFHPKDSVIAFGTISGCVYLNIL